MKKFEINESKFKKILSSLEDMLYLSPLGLKRLKYILIIEKFKVSPAEVSVCLYHDCLENKDFDPLEEYFNMFVNSPGKKDEDDEPVDFEKFKESIKSKYQMESGEHPLSKLIEEVMSEKMKDSKKNKPEDNGTPFQKEEMANLCKYLKFLREMPEAAQLESSNRILQAKKHIKNDNKLSDLLDLYEILTK